MESFCSQTRHDLCETFDPTSFDIKTFVYDNFLNLFLTPSFFKQHHKTRSCLVRKNDRKEILLGSPI